VTNMSHMFEYSEVFNKAISRWDVSNVTNMHGMFYRAFLFDQDLNAWNVSNGTNMRDMFIGSLRANNLPNWYVSPPG